MKRGQSISDPGLAGIITKFAIFLRGHGFRVFQTNIHDALASLKYINLFNRQDFYSTLRANLVNTDMEWSQFSHLFAQFWNTDTKNKRKNSDKAGSKQIPFIEDITEDEVLSKEDKGDSTSSDLSFEQKEEYLEGIGYSPVSRVEKKEISLLNEADIQVARLALKKMSEPFKIQRTRRTKKGLHSGCQIDFPNMMRKSLKFGGYPLELFFKEKRKRLRRLVIIADVSGSMERYASFVIPFILSIRGVGSKAEVFVFSTSLTRVTHLVKHLDIKRSLERITKEMPNWSGGTRIGFSLKQFNQWGDGSLVNKRSVIIILSDGWDLGSKGILKREMETLNRKAHSIIWLNPILNDPDLQRMCKGMQIALPFIDHLIPVNNLEGLKKAGRVISKVLLH